MINYGAYSKMLAVQADMCFPFEKIFYSKTSIKTAKSIIEVGCGNGHYLSLIESNLCSADTVCCGYDINTEFLFEAKKNYPHINFEHGSVGEISDNADIIILRLILHQVIDRTNLLKHLNEKLTEFGQVLVIEPFDAAFIVSPELPYFTKHLKKHREILSPDGTSRELDKIIIGEMESFNFRVETSEQYSMPSFIPGYKDKYLAYMLATCQIIGATQDVYDEIYLWYRDENAFAQIGLFMHCFQRGLE